MNEISLINNFIIELFQSEVLVNTISIVPTIDIDRNKENIYPLVNVDMLTSRVLLDAIVVSFNITVLQQRNRNTKKFDSKLLNDINYIDNMNETHTICTRFINVLQHQNNSLNIEIDTITELKALRESGKGILDGWEFQIDLSIRNMGSSC